jgi:hypothetical protein
MTVTNRSELKAFCLRELGEPLVTVNITDEQIEDRIDTAIEFFNEYYWDGIKKEYFKHQITAQNISDRFIPIPDHIWAVTKVFNASN